MPQSDVVADGIHAPVPRERMSESVGRFRDAYNMVPGAPLYRKEFWLMPGALERWKNEGMPQDVPLHELFGFDSGGSFGLGHLGWCEAAFVPAFEERIVEDRGDHEIAQDYAGRHVLFFKDRRVGFMPEYVAHPVKDQRTWEEDVKWRLDPATPERWADFDQHITNAIAAAGQGLLISQGLVGGYMYLRSLIGPMDILYMVHDNPALIHDCMQAWLSLADAVAARHQEHVTIEEVFFAEDICYNHGPLISPDMMREFLLPYYQQLISNIKSRNIDQSRRVFVQVDTDGFCDPVIPVYREAHGLDMMSPFEVASGCDVVRTAREYPDLVMLGGLDKRVLATTKADIDAMVERVVPTMRARGGYIPTIDHGTPEETPYENYVHFRQRMLELGG
jgi:uroporphyrinogen decarboxylase